MTGRHPLGRHRKERHTIGLSPDCIAAIRLIAAHSGITQTAFVSVLVERRAKDLGVWDQALRDGAKLARQYEAQRGASS